MLKAGRDENGPREKEKEERETESHGKSCRTYLEEEEEEAVVPLWQRSEPKETMLMREESAERMREEEKDSSSGQGIASVQFEVKFNLSSVSHGMLTSHLQ